MRVAVDEAGDNRAAANVDPTVGLGCARPGSHPEHLVVLDDDGGVGYQTQPLGVVGAGQFAVRKAVSREAIDDGRLVHQPSGVAKRERSEGNVGDLDVRVQAAEDHDGPPFAGRETHRRRPDVTRLG